MYRIRQVWWGLVAVVFVGLLAACSSGGYAERTAPPSGQPTVIVATVAVEQEPPTEEPTAVPTDTPTPTPPAPLAAQVNGQYVFLADYEQRLAQYERALLDQGIDLNTDEGQGYLEEAREDVLEGLIDSALIEQAATSLGVAVTEEEIRDQVESDIAAGGGQAAFEEWLQATGQTREGYEQMLRQALVSQRVLEVVVAGVGIDAEQVHVRHIMLDTEEAAQEILDALSEGGDFLTLARERSMDLATKENAGDLGWFPRGMVAPELEEAAFALQAGEISGIVRLGEGYHIIQVVERDPARPLSPEMQIDLQLTRFEEWLAEQRAAAIIERFVGE